MSSRGNIQMGKKMVLKFGNSRVSEFYNVSEQSEEPFAMLCDPRIVSEPL